MMVSVQRWGGSPELHPITAITEDTIIVAEYSGRVCYPNGQTEMIGQCKRTRLDRKRLEAGAIYRRKVRYELVAGDDLTIDGICSEAFNLILSA